MACDDVIEVRLLLRRLVADRVGDPEDLAAIGRFADWYGLGLLPDAAPPGSVVLTGTMVQFEEVFSVIRVDGGRAGASGRVASLRLPSELQGRVVAVVGLDGALPAAR